jgi:hypothetical protein
MHLHNKKIKHFDSQIKKNQRHNILLFFEDLWHKAARIGEIRKYYRGS